MTSSSDFFDVIKKPEDEAKSSQDPKSLAQKKEDYLEKEIWVFSIDNVEWIWDIVVDNLKEYEPIYFKRLKEFLNKSQNDKENATKYLEEFTEWENENPNPLKKIVEKCDAILKRFQLRINTEEINMMNHNLFYDLL